MPHELDNLALALRQAQDAWDAAQPIKRAPSSLSSYVPGLVKRAIARDTIGPTVRPKTVSQYGVIGLPPGQRATITKFGLVWKTLLFRNGHSVCEWEGEYSDADAALEALDELVGISRSQGAATRAAG
jgi:hypothetical protein